MGTDSVVSDRDECAAQTCTAELTPQQPDATFEGVGARPNTVTTETTDSATESPIDPAEGVLAAMQAVVTDVKPEVVEDDQTRAESDQSPRFTLAGKVVDFTLTPASQIAISEENGASEGSLFKVNGSTIRAGQSLGTNLIDDQPKAVHDCKPVNRQIQGDRQACQDSGEEKASLNNCKQEVTTLIPDTFDRLSLQQTRLDDLHRLHDVGWGGLEISCQASVVIWQRRGKMSPGNPSQKSPARRGRPPGSANKRALFDLERGMEILYDLAHRPENLQLTRHQVFDVASRFIYYELFSDRGTDQDHMRSHLERISKRLEREQTRRDNGFISGLISLSEDHSEERGYIFNAGPFSDDAEPFPLDWEHSADRLREELYREFPTLPQGLDRKTMAEYSFSEICVRPSVKRRKL